jgi:hypothetical protein
MSLAANLSEITKKLKKLRHFLPILIEIFWLLLLEAKFMKENYGLWVWLLATLQVSLNTVNVNCFYSNVFIAV